ncbi:MAG: thymidine phosphorylase, partial [Dethiobacteria bacterium]
YFQGLNNKETSAFTLSLAETGEMLDFSSLGKIVADKHSSGGVGDKVTLVLAPLIAAAGVPVAKISGRGLGFTGGTIDKLESIPGFSANLSIKEFTELVRDNNLAIMAQTDLITPADGKLYALRDVTGTIENISLIAASIMSKKIAAGAGAILLDVKTGRGAFMHSKEQAFQLAESMVRIGKEMGRRVVSVVTDMSQPLGFAVGNILEVKEALSVLRGEGPSDVEQLSLFLGGLMLALVGKVRNPEDGQEELSRLLKSGFALEKFKQMVTLQGGDPGYLEKEDLFPRASYLETLRAPRGGYLKEMDALRVGKVASFLGAGRSVKGETIDPTVGIVLTRKVGDSVEEGEVLAFLHGNKEEILSASLKELGNAFLIADDQVEPPEMIHGIVPPFPS